MRKLPCILLVDDDQTSNYINQKLLEKMEVTDSVMVATNGQKALEVLQQLCAEGTCPQLILLDLKMPVLDGFGFLEAYEQLELKQKDTIVIVALTTSLNPRDVNRLQTLPIQAYLNKPISKEKIQELLRTHFG